MVNVKDYTRCGRGHYMSERNTYRRADGRSECHTCRHLRFKEQHRRRRMAHHKAATDKPAYPSTAPVTWQKVPKYAEDDAVIVSSAAMALTVSEVLSRILAMEAGALAPEERRAVKWYCRALEAELLAQGQAAHLRAEAGKPIDNGGG